MKEGRTRIAGPMLFKDKTYNLIIYYDNAYKRYSLQFVEGDWQPTVINIVASVNLSVSDQATFADPKALVLDRIAIMNAILRTNVFGVPPEPSEVWVTNLEAAIMNLEIKLIGDIPQVAVKEQLPI
jgi:hypothetical protein